MNFRYKDTLNGGSVASSFNLHTYLETLFSTNIQSYRDVFQQLVKKSSCLI
jgi:hypothetical protein